MKKLCLSLVLLSWAMTGIFAGGGQETPPIETITEIPPSPPPVMKAEDGPPWSIEVDDSVFGWWNEAVWYEIYVRSFRDSDGDGVGDLRGLIEKLDYLNDGDPNTTQDLGITGIWLMPIQKNGPNDPHGYHIIDYYQVHEEYGSNEDFKALIREAKKRGIKVIIDLVINHTGKDHPWFRSALEDPEGPYRDYYVWKDHDPGIKGSWGQTVWHHAGGDNYYYGVFNGNIPDLNLANPKVTEEIYKITQFWTQEMGADGFRIDAVKYFVENESDTQDTPENLEWFRRFNQFYKGLNQELYTIGEVWSSTETVAQYVGGKLDSAFEFDLAAEIIQATKSGSSIKIRNHFEKMLELYPSNQYGTFLTNHDQTRIMSQIGNMDRMKMAASILLTISGQPYLYYGEELGLLGEGSDDDKRRPMQWDNTENLGFTDGPRPYGRGFNQGAKDRTVANQNNDPESLLSHYRNLIQLRNRRPSLQKGEMVLLDASNSRLFAFLRYREEEVSLVVINLSSRAQDSYELTLWQGPFKPGLRAEGVYGPSTDLIAPQINAFGGFEKYRPLESIPPLSTVIIDLK